MSFVFGFDLLFFFFFFFVVVVVVVFVCFVLMLIFFLFCYYFYLFFVQNKIPEKKIISRKILSNEGKICFRKRVEFFFLNTFWVPLIFKTNFFYIKEFHPNNAYFI